MQPAKVNARELRSLVELAQHRALERGGATLYTWLADGELETDALSFAALDARARALAVRLRERTAAGERALLLLPPGLDFITAFFGCLYAGIVAVPAHPPRSGRPDDRLRAIARDARPALVLHPAPERAAALTAHHTELADAAWLDTHAEPALAPSWVEPRLEPETVAFLQYTSGSTSSPKGVMVSHGNLLANSAMIGAGFGTTQRSVVVGWLPLFHDMGLIGNVLQPLYAGCRAVLTSPTAFLQRPGRWLEAISRYRGTISGGPNFAYELCVQRLAAEQRARLDLASWEVAFNGAEPVRATTLERFADAFAAAGFDPRALFPCYGLAEATLFVSGGPPRQLPRVQALDLTELARGRAVPVAGAGGRSVSCGTPATVLEVRIVDPQTHLPLPAGGVGEIWLRGPSVARGYWNRREETALSFGARLTNGGEAWLRSGDLGFLHPDGSGGGELFVTGRLKDLVILRGRNCYPQDLELSAEQSHPALVASAVAAFAVESDDEERLVVVAEIARRRESEAATAAAAIRKAIADEHEVATHEVVVIRQGTLPKTSSGKVQRHGCRDQYRAGELTILARRGTPAPDQRHAEIEAWLRHEAVRLGASNRPDAEITFPSLGLDSLAAVELAHRLESELGARIAPTALLGGGELSSLAAASESRVETPSRHGGAARSPARFALAHGQQALWFLQRLAPESAAYHLAIAGRVRGELDPAAFRRACTRLVERHPALRTIFGDAAGTPYQEVLEQAELDFSELVLSAGPSEVERRLRAEADRPFALEHGPLLRVRLAQAADGERVLLLVLHHLIADLWSLALAVGELGALYREERGGATAALASPAASYADVVTREHERLVGAEGERLWGYWREQLSGELPTLELPADRPRPALRSGRGGAAQRALGPAAEGALRSLAAGQGATPFAVLLTAFKAQLFRLSGQGDLTVGTPSWGREQADLAGVFGYCVNPVVVRTRLAAQLGFASALTQVSTRILEALAHQGFPFPWLAERLRIARDPGRAPIFQVMLALQHAPGPSGAALGAFALGAEGTRLELGGLVLEPLRLPMTWAQFDLHLTCAEAPGGPLAELCYATDLFDPTTAQRLLAQLETLLVAAAAEPHRRLGELPWLSAAERHQLALEWNDTRTQLGDEHRLHRLVAAQTARAPEAVAAVFESSALSYGGLTRAAHRVAVRLSALGIGTETRVGIHLERSLELIVALLGTVEAGAAWVPLDPGDPAERLRFLLEDSAVEVVIGRGERPSSLAPTTVFLDLDPLGSPAQSSLAPAPSHPESLAYTIYTSGSTGRPKGAMNSHRALCNRLLWMVTACALGRAERVLQKTPTTFDVSVWELFVPLVSGGVLVLARPGGHRDPAYLARLITRERITTAHFVPALLRVFLEQRGIESCSSLARVVASGEALEPDLVGRFDQRSSAVLYNLYGPTEAAIEVSVWRCERAAGAPGVPIGRPIANLRLRLLDPRFEPVPAGVPAQLCLGGVGLARGYLGRPGLTAEKFVPDLFATATAEAGARLYQSGDLARLRGDGAVEFLGRLDHQVKLRGLRIELGEIETRLAAHPAVHQAVVVLRPDRQGEPRLVAYWVTRAQHPPAPRELAAHLAARLPAPMIPAIFEPLDALPLTASGKIDRRALPEPSEPRGAGMAAGETPGTAVEALVAAACCDLLGLEQIGRGEDFFTLGGHSLLAVRLVARLAESCGVELPLLAVFEAPTVAGLAATIERARAAKLAPCEVPPLVPLAADAPKPLSYAQERLWFLDRLVPTSTAYNLLIALDLEGALDLEALARSLGTIAARHEVLRTRFEERDGHPVQVVDALAPFPLPRVDLARLVDPEAAAHRLARALRRRPIDLGRGPLLRSWLLCLRPGRAWLLCATHHIVFDGSHAVFFGELTACYRAFATGSPPVLPPLAPQFADIAAWERLWLSGARLETRLAYWRERLRGLEPLDLPGDRPRPPLQGFRGALRPCRLPAVTTAALEALARRSGATLFMVAMAAFQTLLARWAGRSDFAVGVPMAHRPHPAAEGLIGSFVNTVALRAELGVETTAADAVTAARTAILEAQAHRDVPFERIVEALRPGRDLSRPPLVEVMLTLTDLATEQRDWQLPGLAASWREIDGGSARLDLLLALRRTGSEIEGFLEFDRDLFDATTAERLLRHYRRLAAELAARPERRLRELPLLDPSERAQLVVAWNDTAAPLPGHTVCTCFRTLATAAPERIAVLGDGESQSYGELARRADRLAHRLRALGVGPGVPVGIYLHRSPRLVEALVAVQAAGGFYVPLDAALPPARVAWILAFTRAEHLLTETALLPALAAPPARVLCLDRPDAGDVAGAPAPTAARLTGDDLAYVMFTSGSTGTPKGVAVRHRPLANLVEWVNTSFEIGADDRLLFVTSPGFDLSVYDVFGTLAAGAALRVASAPELAEPARLVAVLERERISFWDSAPAALRQLVPFLGAHPPGAARRALRLVFLSGDWIPVALPDEVRGAFPAARVVSLGGATEATIWSNVYRVAAVDPRWPSIPYGRPICNAAYHVLDPWLEPCPIGVAGDLVIGGECLAAGYFRGPVLTAERFGPDPFSAAPGGRLYHTGDRARWRAQGELEFLGRRDGQVKIRGYRIELGEIEAVLARHPGVRQAAVVAHQEGSERRLAAYIAAGSGAADGPGPDEPELRRFLAAQLPDYMVPGLWSFLPELPLSASGKLDRRALPAPQPSARRAGRAPQTPAEQLIAELWTQLLGRAQIGADDDFFELGGHSLAAAQLVSRLRQLFAVELPVRAVFEQPTVAGLALAIASERGTPTAPPLTRRARRGLEPLSFAQERLWFLHRLDPASPVYNLPIAVHLAGALATPVLTAALAAALGELARRHEILRTLLLATPEGPRQRVEPPAPVALPIVELAALAAPARRREATAQIALAARRPFDLAAEPPLRCLLLDLGAGERTLLVNQHHVASDGWSMRRLLSELAALYQAALGAAPSPWPEPALGYLDYALWQREWLEGGVLETLLEGWRRRLDGAPELLELPTDRPRPTTPSGRGARIALGFGSALERGLHALGRRAGTTPFMTTLAALAVAFGRWARRDDVVIGSPFANRDRQEVESILGCFVNALPLRCRPNPDADFFALLAAVRGTVLSAFAAQQVPFERLVQTLRPRRETSHHPLFQVMFSFEPPPAELGLPGLSARVEEVPNGGAKFDLEVALLEGDDGLTAVLEYSRELFDPTTIRRFGQLYERLLGTLVATPERPLAALPTLAAAERHQLAVEHNDTALALPLGASIHGLMAAQAAATPEAVALVCGDEHLSYRELRRRAGALATRLKLAGVARETIVGLCAERSPELMLALFAILEAGGAYLPLDPSYPADRLAFMVGETGGPVLAQRQLAPALPAGARVLWLEDQLAAARAAETATLPLGPDDQNLAYVIYTSGSTGRPKGVMNRHRGVVSHLLWMQQTFPLGTNDRVLQKSPSSFDASVWELFWPLAMGAALVLARPEGHRDPAYLGRLIAERRITTLHFVPSMLAALLAEPGIGPLPSLRQLIVGGEALTGELARRAAERTGVPVYNLYGPTETTVEASWWPCPARTEARVLPIGAPVANTGIYLLDGRLRLVPLGVSAELAIGGVQLARGYFGRPALTAERFVPDSFAGRAGARLYRTGDLARRLAAGTIEFLGRLDHQVKLRGQRIELGEIEAALGLHPAVRGAAVVLAPGAGPGDGRLVAHVAADPAPSAEQLRRHLLERLPEAMVPALFVILPELPLTPSGKVDRRALPEPEIETAAGAAAPRSPLETAVAEVFAQVLGVARVGLRDDFFGDLGGHSLLATRVVARVRELWDAPIELRAFFEQPTVEGVAAGVAAVLGHDTGGALATAPPPLGPRPRGAVAVASFAQERLWFLDRLEPASAVYNIPAALRLRGRLDVAALTRALAHLTARHESLRTSLHEQSGELVQVVVARPTLRFAELDLRRLEPGVGERNATERLIAEARRPFELDHGPLWRALLVRLAGEEHALLLNLHHVIADGWSVAVIQRELGQLYGELSAGGSPRLAPPALQYADWALWQRRWLDTGGLEPQLAFWREQLAGAPTLLELPTDRPRPAIDSHRGRRLSFALPTALTSALDTVARSAGATRFMVLLAGFAALLHRSGGITDLVVGSPIAGRHRGEIESLVGLFVNTLALRARPRHEQPFGELLAAARRGALGAYAHQDLPFEKLVETLRPERSLAHAPLFQVFFVLQNLDAAEPSLPGLAATAWEVDNGTAKVDLNLTLVETRGELAGVLETRVDLFDLTTAHRLVLGYRRLLEAVASDASRQLAELELLTPAERHQMLREWGGGLGPREDLQSGTLHALFAEQARRAPEATALTCAGQALSYGELDRRAERLARRLRPLGVGPEVPVALAVERSLEMVVAILGILETGGYYVPLDLGTPPERLAFVLADAGARLAVVDTRGDGALAGLARTVRVGPSPEALPDLALDLASGSARHPSGPDHLAYVMYTSGSTGRPKGVSVRHRSVLRLVRGNDFAALGAEEVWLQFAPLAFDASTLELWGPLLNGGRLAVMPPGTPSLGELGAVLRHERVNALWLTAGLFHQMVDERLDDLRGLRQLLAGGDALLAPQVRAVRAGAPEVRLINGYGPTENTTFTCCHTFEPAQRLRSPVSIGRPIRGTWVCVVDRALRPQPIGVAGELLTGGEGLARNYLARPALTAEKFVPDPLSGRRGERLYRTGDQVRWLADGRIEFLGRRDQQIKLRGYRIELGEVEAALLSHPRIAQAAVHVHGERAEDRRLVAYVVADDTRSHHAGPQGDESAPSAADLRELLGRRLPSYMIPSAIVALAEMPLGPTGKVDRRALPAPGRVRGERAPSAAPRSPIEEALAALWAEVLERDHVGRDDDFFALGGHSLLATRLIARARESLGVSLPLRELFERPTVAGLASVVEAGLGAPAPPALPPVEPAGADPAALLTPAQERMLLFSQLSPESGAFNIPIALRLGGRLDRPSLERALVDLLRRHTVLRTGFRFEDGRPSPQPAATLVPLLEIDLGGLPPRARTQRRRQLERCAAARPFDLARGPLLRALLLRLAATERVLLLTLHHVAADGASIMVLTRELLALYRAHAGGCEPALPEPRLQFSDFAAWQRRCLAERRFEREIAAWREQLAGVPAVLELPTDRPRPATPSHRGATVRFEIAPELARAVATLGRERGATPVMVFIAALAALLHQRTDQGDLVLGLGTANRRPETEPLVGCFFNLVPLRTRLEREMSFRELLAQVREVALGAYARQELPFEVLLDALEIERRPGFAPLVQVLVEAQSTPWPRLELPGLEVEILELAGESAKLDLTFFLRPGHGGEIIGNLEHDTALFTAATIERLLGDLLVVIAAAVADPDAELGTLLPRAEPRAEITAGFTEDLAAW